MGIVPPLNSQIIAQWEWRHSYLRPCDLSHDKGRQEDEKSSLTTKQRRVETEVSSHRLSPLFWPQWAAIGGGKEQNPPSSSHLGPATSDRSEAAVTEVSEALENRSLEAPSVPHPIHKSTLRPGYMTFCPSQEHPTKLLETTWITISLQLDSFTYTEDCGSPRAAQQVTKERIWSFGLRLGTRDLGEGEISIELVPICCNGKTNVL